MQTLTLFVSSPGDVRDERQAVGRIVERLQARYWNFIRLEPVLWEKEPLRATAHFNEELVRPSDCDLFVCVLWSRLGSPLPSQFNRKDGTRFDSGTEWELEEATDAYETRAAEKDVRPKPDILVYRRMSDPPPGGDEGAKREQKKKLDAFCERFFFNPDKTIRRAFSPYETVDEFMALLEQHLEKLLLRHIQLQRGLAEDAVRPLPIEGSPFKGLGAFDFEDAPLFFGRNRPIAEALAVLKENHAAGHAFLLIYGGSGYGKSSLMRAGLAPRLTADGYLPEVGGWCGTTVLPVEGDAPPVETLARGILDALPELTKLQDTSVIGEVQPSPPAPAGRKKKQRGKSRPKPVEAVWDVARLTRKLGKPSELVFAVAAIVAALDRLAAGKPAHLLVMVDQLEELFTAKDITAETLDGFFHVLATLAMSGRVWVVATMRSEFFPRVPEHRDLFQLVRHGGGYILSPPELPELHQIIRYPALAAGLQFERHPESGRDLSEQIYQDAADAQDALPLLEFTLEEIYQRREGNLLTWSSYHDLGGLSGAIARRAQETYDALPLETRREAAARLFGELVTLDAANEGPATRRRAKRAMLEKAHPGAPGFLREFIGAKLLVTGSERDEATVTLAHEALITHWPVLRQWIADHRDLLMARRRLEDATRLWVGGQRSPKFLLAEGRLAEADRVATGGMFLLSAEEEELVRLSRLRAKRKLRMFQMATGIFAVLAVAAGALGVVARNKQLAAKTAEEKANFSAAETKRSLAAADFDAGAARVEAGAPGEAIPLLISALENDPSHAAAQAVLVDTLRQTAWHFPTGDIAHPVPVTRLAFGPDGGTLYASTGSTAGGFNSTLRWDMNGGRLHSALSPSFGEETQALVVSPDGKRVIIQRGYKRADVTLLCDAETLKPIKALDVPSGIPEACFAWSPDGALLGYPKMGAAPEFSLTWVIAESSTGRTIRESAPLPRDTPDAVAAWIDRTHLRGLSEDLTVIELPLVPSQPERRGKSIGGNEIEAALISPTGVEIFARSRGRDSHDAGLHSLFEIRDEEGELSVLYSSQDARGRWLDSASVLDAYPWSDWEAPVWTDLFDRVPAGRPVILEHGAGAVRSPLSITGAELRTADVRGESVEPRAPFTSDSLIRAVAFSGDRFAIGGHSGTLQTGRYLPRLLESWPETPGQGDTDSSVWDRMKLFPDGTAFEMRGNDARLKPADESRPAVTLAMHPHWQMVVDVALHPSEQLAVVAGYGSGSGGLVSPGILLEDASTGEVLSSLEPVAAVSRADFIGDRLAVAGEAEVTLMAVERTGFRRMGSIPVTRGQSFFALQKKNGRPRLAIAAPEGISIYDLGDLSKIATLPFREGKDIETEGWLAVVWAHEPARDWLACRAGQELHVWDLASGRRLISPRLLPRRDLTPAFVVEQGLVGVRFGEDEADLLPLATADPLTATRLDALRALGQGLGGMRFSAGTRSLERLGREARTAALRHDFSSLDGLLPPGRAGEVAAMAVALPVLEVPAETWLPLWERLLLATDEDEDALTRWIEPLEDHPWRQGYLRGRIGATDTDFYSLLAAPAKLDGDSKVPEEAPDFASLLRQAGEPEDAIAAKRAAWLLLRTRPETAGAALAKAAEADELPEPIDPGSLATLEPEAVAKLERSLEGTPRNDWLVLLMEDLKAGPAARETLDRYLAAARERYGETKSQEDGFRLAEALMLSADAAAARTLIGDLVKDDSVPSLAAAHFIIAAGFGDIAAAAMDRALEQHDSPWLWIDWLESVAATDAPLAPAVTRVMTAAGGKGLPAVSSLELSLREQDPDAIRAAVEGAADLPDVVKNYALARVLWISGNKAALFTQWPDSLPIDFGYTETMDLGGWERTLKIGDNDRFSTEVQQELAKIEVKQQAEPEELAALGELLLEKETTATYGVARVRRSQLACASALADHEPSAELVGRLVDRARLTGAPHFDCLRVEARSLMAQGDFTAAYARWLQLLENNDAGVTATDFQLAARCVMEDLQDAAAVELLKRGHARFPTDSTYALEASWLLLTMDRPEDAGIILEASDFSRDQAQSSTAMLLAAAELTGRHQRADEAYRKLLTLSPEWGQTESIEAAGWPESLTRTLLDVAKRNRQETMQGEEPAADE